jgi:hypothetical protein
MTSPIELPLVGGVREDIERAVLPDGLLRSVHNYRIDKPGRLVRRRGYANRSSSPFYDDPVGVTAQYVLRMYYFDGQVLAFGQEQALESQYPGQGGLFMKGLSSRYWYQTYYSDDTLIPPAPCSDVIPKFNVRLMEDARYCSAATVDNYTIIAWKDGSALHAAVYDTDGGLIYQEQIDTPIDECTTIAVGVYLYVVWRDGTAINYRYYDTGGNVASPTTVQYTNSADNTDPAWDITVDNDSSDELVIAFNHSDTTVHVDALDGSAIPWTAVAGLGDTYATIGDRGLAVARYGANATILLVGDTSGSGTLSAVMWNGTLEPGNQQAAVVLESAFDWTYGPFTVNCDATGYWAAWSFDTRPTGYASACDVQQTKHKTLDPTGPSAGSTKLHYRMKVGGKARDGYCWMQYGRAASTQRQYILVTGFGGATEKMVACTSFRVAGETLGVEDCHPLSQPCPDGNGNYVWAARELYDGELSRASGTENKVGIVVHEYSLTSPERAASAKVGSLHFAGGVHRTWDQAHVIDPPYCSPDPMDGGSWLSNTGSGSLTGTYYWKVVYAAWDAQGNVWRSAPSAELSYSGLGAAEVTIRVEGVGFPGYWAEVYRQHTDNTWRYVGATAMNPNSETVDIIDDGSSIADRELLYTTGGEPASYPTPSSSVMCEWNRRLFVASYNKLYYSHTYDYAQGRNSAPWMVETFYLQFLEPITGLAPLDSILLVFTASSIHFISGDGPNRTGSGGYFAQQQISSDVGCTDWRSIATYRDGVVFRSQRGFEMIPKGGLSVAPFGDPVEDTAAEYTETTSAVVQPELDQIRWTLSSSDGGIIVVWDYIAKEWSTESAPAYGGAQMIEGEYSVWSGKAAVSNAAYYGRAWQQADQYYDDDGDGTTTAYTSSIETGDIRSGGKIGWQSIHAVDLLGSLEGQAWIEIAAAYDGEDEYLDAETINHYVPIDVTSSSSLIGATYVAATGVLTEDNTDNEHKLYRSLTKGTSIQMYARAVVSGLGRGLIFKTGSSGYLVLGSDGSWYVSGTGASGSVQDLTGGRYLLELLTTPVSASETWEIGGHNGTSSVYLGDSRDICTIESFQTGYVDWSSAMLRQRFTPRVRRCEGIRLKISDSSFEAGAALTALRLDVKPKRKAGRLPSGSRS